MGFLMLQKKENHHQLVVVGVVVVVVDDVGLVACRREVLIDISTSFARDS
jgi:hypothetical protein